MPEIRDETAVETLADLQREYDDATRIIANEVDRQRAITARVHEIIRAGRPAFPTDAHRVGLMEAARRIRGGDNPGSHHGDPCGPKGDPYAVRVTGATGWLSFGHGAPILPRGGGGRAWRFTDDDVAALLALVEAQGFTVAHHWRHDEGLSVRVEMMPS